MKKKFILIGAVVLLALAGTVIWLLRWRNERTITNTEAGFIAKVKVERKQAGEDTVVHINQFWYKNTIVYALDLATYKDSNKDGTGDIKGLIRQLGYIRGLGIETIWLAPFHAKQPLDTSGASTDPYTVDKRLGTMADFAKLVQEAQKWGIRLLMELPVKQPYSVQQAIDNDSMVVGTIRAVNFWLDKGIAGFGLTGPAYKVIATTPPDSRSAEQSLLFTELRHVVQAKRQEGILLGNIPAPPADRLLYFGKNGNGLHLLINDRTHQYLQLALATGETRKLAEALTSTRDIPAQSQWMHGLQRSDTAALTALNKRERSLVATLSGTDSSRRVELAYSMILAMPGTPVIGQEADTALLNRIAGLLNIRRSLPVPGKGDWKVIPSGSPGVLLLQYDWEEESILTMHNFSGQLQTVELSPRKANRTLTNLLKSETIFITGNAPYSYQLEGYGYRWYRVH